MKTNPEQLTGWRYALSLLLLLAGGCGGSSGGVDPAPPPLDPIDYFYAEPLDLGDGWTVAHAGEQGVGVETLERMMHSIDDGDFGYVDSIAIARDGVLVFEETIRTDTDSEDSRVGNTDPRLHRQFSVSKSITALLVGIAIDDGYIANTDVPFLDLFPYASYDNWDARKNDITLGHVLAMQAGFEWNEWDPPYSSPQNRLIRFYDVEVDYSKALLDLPLAADPGKAFAYNTAASVALGQAIENSVPLSVIDYAGSSLFLPLRIEQIEVLTTPTGLPDGGSGLYLTTRDAAKFAQLMLDGGQFGGERVVSEGWVAELVTPRTAIGRSNPEDWAWQISGYGYQWWTGYYEFDGRDVETWVAWGFGGQWIVAIPEFGLAIAINSHGYDGADEGLDQGHRLVRDFILPAIAQ